MRLAAMPIVFAFFAQINFMTLRNIKLTLCFLFSALFSYKQSLATHLSAADIRADYIGTSPTDQRYIVTLTTYTGCEPAAMAFSLYESIDVYLSDTPLYYVRLSLISSDTLQPYCPQVSVLNSCRSASSVYPGYVRAVYADTITLPRRDSNVVFGWWSYGSRNLGITNLDPDRPMFISCGVNSIVRYNASSPRFLSAPVLSPGVNDGVKYANSPYCSTADSLNIFPIQPRMNKSTLVAYAAGYSVSSPIATTPGNPHVVKPWNGNVYFSPNVTGKFQTACQVSQYDPRTGQLLGFAQREIQFAVVPAGGISPRLSDTVTNLAGGVLNQGIINITAGTALHFDVTASGMQGIQCSSDHSFTASGSNVVVTRPTASSVNGRFSWTPANTDTGFHYVTFTATDTTCAPGQVFLPKSSQTVAIRVLKQTGGTAVVSLNGKNTVRIYPNPAKEALRIDMNDSRLLILDVYSITGQRVLHVDHPGNSVDVRHLAPGHYTVKIITDKGPAIATFTRN